MCRSYRIFILLSFGVMCLFALSEYPCVTLNVQLNKAHNFLHNKQYYDSFSTYKPHFGNYTLHDFRNYFEEQGYSESQIVSQRCLYMFDGFVEFAQTYPGYKSAIEHMHAKLKRLNYWQKAYYIVKGTYCVGLQKRIRFLYKKLQNECKQLQQKNNISQGDNTSGGLAATYNPLEQITNDYASAISYVQVADYKELNTIYQAYTPSLWNALEQRLHVVDRISEGCCILSHEHKAYELSNEIEQLLEKYSQDTLLFTQCCGNQLQQIIHEESLEILNRIDCLPSNSLLYDHQEALVDLTAAIVGYNHEAFIDKSMHIADLCWALLDYGQAVAEGVVLGVHSAVQDILSNPVEATISMVIGKQVLAFQLGKVLYNVVDIGITATVNFDEAQQKWDKYTVPLNNLIDAINKKEIAIRDVIKDGTALLIGYKTQSKLLGGLGKFCNTIKQKSINFVKNNVLLNPQEYLTTPEGLLFKAATQSSKTEQFTASNLKNNIDNTIFKHKSIKGLIKTEGLPTKGKLRYVPPKKLQVAEGLPRVTWHDRRRGYIDRFGNVWLKGKSRTQGHDFEWDVQLSKQGIQQVGWMTSDNSHLNVSLDGKVTHK